MGYPVYLKESISWFFFFQRVERQEYGCFYAVICLKKETTQFCFSLVSQNILSKQDETGGIGETMKEPKCPECRREYEYLLFGPVFGLRYLLENVHPACYYHPVHCRLDERIPFLEAFMIPYAAWYLYIVGMHL